MINEGAILSFRETLELNQGIFSRYYCVPVKRDKKGKAVVGKNSKWTIYQCSVKTKHLTAGQLLSVPGLAESKWLVQRIDYSIWTFTYADERPWTDFFDITQGENKHDLVITPKITTNDNSSSTIH
jgi:hypothetical protein